MNFEENKTCCPQTNEFRQNLARLRGERLKPPLQTLIVGFINGHIFEKPLIVGLINRHILEKPLTILLTDGTL